MKLLGLNITPAAAERADPMARLDAFARWGAATAPELRASPENPKYSLSDPSVLAALGLSDSGAVVTPNNAMQAAAVFSCVRILAESLAQLPVYFYKREGKVRTRVGQNDKGLPVAIASAIRVLTSQPNPIMSVNTLFEQQQTQLSLWGNAYLQRVFDTRTDETIALYPLASSNTAPQISQGTDERGYPELQKRYRIGSQMLGYEDIVHVPLLSLDGVIGLSPITLNRLGISVSMSQQQFAASFYANGTKLSGTLEHPGKLSSEAAARLRENWTTVYAGSTNSGKVAILEEAMKFTPLTMPLEDAQFIDTMKFSREQIASIFRVPPHMIGHLERATFSNIEQQGLDFSVYTLGPYLVKWEQALSAALIPPGLRDTYYLKFNMESLLRGDFKTRNEAYAVARQWGWLSVNDILEAEDRNPIPNGDIYIQPMNMIEAGKTPPRPTKDGAKPDATA